VPAPAAAPVGTPRLALGRSLPGIGRGGVPEHGLPGFHPRLPYNSPLVLMESVAMFMAFSAMRFRSRAVNHAAKSAFAVYLVHKSQLVFGSIFKPLMLKCWGAMSLGSFTGFMLLFAVGIYLALMPADWVRRRVWLGLLKLKAERREKPPVRPKSLS
jgi:hypothetical protein